MDRKQIRDRILYRINDDRTSPAFATIAQVNTTIQEGLEVIAEEITDLRRQAFITLEPGRWLYSLNEIGPDVMGIMHIWNEKQSDVLQAVTMGELDNHRTEWMTVRGAPEWWFPVSWDAFGIHPGPISGGSVLRVDYIGWPKALQNDTDEPVFGEDEQDLLIMYGQYDWMIRQWETDRAEDIFNTFVQAFRDSTFKRRTRRFQHIRMNRNGSSNNFPER